MTGVGFHTYYLQCIAISYIRVRRVCCRLLLLHVSVSVSVFPGSVKVTSEGLLHLRNFTNLWTLQVTGVQAGLIRGQDGQGKFWGWLRRLPTSVWDLDITGEL